MDISLHSFVGVSLLMASLSPQDIQDIHTDGHLIASFEETTRFYDCGGISGSLRYRTERFQKIDDIARARRVTLLGISVNGRELPPAQLVDASALFRTFGEIESLGSLCVNEFLEIRVFGVLPSVLARSLEDDDLWTSEFHVIRLSPAGVVFVQ